MKYLIEYKVFENSTYEDEIKSYIGDVFIDLDSLGLKYLIQINDSISRLKKRWVGGRTIIIYITAIDPYKRIHGIATPGYFKLFNIKDEVLHLISYMNSQDINLISASYRDEGKNWHNLYRTEISKNFPDDENKDISKIFSKPNISTDSFGISFDLPKSKLYESSVVPGSDNSNLLKILNSSKEWYISEDKPEHHQFQYLYDIDEDYKISIVYFTNMNMAYYILDENGIFHYVDSVFGGYNRLHKYDSILDRIINTCKDSMPIFYDRKYIPDHNLIKNVIFIELIEDFGFRVREREMFGFVSEDRLNEYNRGEEPYFPKDHKSLSNPKLYTVYEQYDSDGTVDSDDIIDYFKHAKERIKLLGYNVKCEMFITSTRYYNGSHRPEEIIITMERK